MANLRGPLQELCDVCLLKAPVSGEELQAVAVEWHVGGGEHDGPVV